MVEWHHRLNGHEFEQTPGDGEGQGSLACCSPWGHKESDTTEWLNNNNAGQARAAGDSGRRLIPLYCASGGSGPVPPTKPLSQDCWVIGDSGLSSDAELGRRFMEWGARWQDHGVASMSARPSGLMQWSWWSMSTWVGLEGREKRERESAFQGSGVCVCENIAAVWQRADLCGTTTQLHSSHPLVK